MNPPFDLMTYAKEHRLRTRNLHDGNPVPPARTADKTGMVQGHWGHDRLDAIVGYNGYVAMDGDRLSVCLFYKSGKGVKRAVHTLTAIEAEIAQIGDTEVGATAPVGCLQDLLALIRVSRLKPGSPNPAFLGTETVNTPNASSTPEMGSDTPENVLDAQNPVYVGVGEGESCEP